MSEIRLDTPHGCRDELQRCANGIAQLIPELTKAIRHETEVQVQCELAEAIATVEIADALPKITATEMKARVVKRLSDDPDGVRAVRLLATAGVTALNARMRALEKRLSAAQSALNDHRNEERSAGFVNAGTRP
jgi:hypothetical protein